MTLPRLLPLCVLVLGLALPTTAQEPLTPTSTGAHSDDSRDVGIHVSGAWTITVEDPDGTVVERREFENALTPEGANTIQRILTTGYRGNWIVTVIGAPSPCFRTVSGGGVSSSPCFMIKPNTGGPDADNHFHTLEAVETSGLGHFFLKGSLTVRQENSEIRTVATYLNACGRDCSDEYNDSAELFTQKVLPDDQVLSGLEIDQIVNVEVKIGFE